MLLEVSLCLTLIKISLPAYNLCFETASYSIKLQSTTLEGAHTKRRSSYHHGTSYETSSCNTDVKYYYYKVLIVSTVEAWHSLCILLFCWCCVEQGTH